MTWVGNLMMNRTVMCVLTAALASYLMAQQQQQVVRRAISPSAARIEAPPAGIALPMQDLKGRPVVEVKVNGKGPFTFIFDSGASSTVFSDTLVKELNIPQPEGMRAMASGGSQPITIHTVESLGVGGMKLGGLTVPALPLGTLLSGEDAPRGILAVNTLRGYVTTFDYPGRRITVKKGELGPADGVTVFGYPSDRVLPSVPVSVGGQEIWVDLDTGSAYGLSLPRRYMSELPLAGEPHEAGKVSTMGGTFPVMASAVKGEVKIGQHGLSVGEVRFSDVRPGNGPVSANVGYEVLKGFVVAVDPANRRVSLTK